MFKLELELFCQAGGVVLHPFDHHVEHGGRDQKTVAVQAVDLQSAIAQTVNGGQIVGQRGASLGGHFQDARLGKAAVHGVGGAQQFKC